MLIRMRSGAKSGRRLPPALLPVTAVYPVKILPVYLHLCLCAPPVLLYWLLVLVPVFGTSIPSRQFQPRVRDALLLGALIAITRLSQFWRMIMDVLGRGRRDC